MVCYADKMMNCDEVFVSSVYRFKENTEEFRKIDRNDKCYIIIDSDELGKVDDFKDNDSGVAESRDTNGQILFDSEAFNDRITEQDVIDNFENVVFPDSHLEFYGTEEIFGGEVKIYELVQNS